LDSAPQSVQLALELGAPPTFANKIRGELLQRCPQALALLLEYRPEQKRGALVLSILPLHGQWAVWLRSAEQDENEPSREVLPIATLELRTANVVPDCGSECCVRDRRRVGSGDRSRGLRMELRHLRYFVAVAEESSFTRAAERLWIAQPGLSQQILSLERELGVSLFERLSRGVELTDAGRVFLEKARVAINAADDALAIAQDAATGMTGTLRLGLSWRSRYNIAPDLEHVFTRNRPGVDVTTVESATNTLLRDVRDRRLDAAIVLGPQDLRPAMETLMLSHGPVGLLMAADHPLATLRSLKPEDLQRQVFMVSGDGGAGTYDDQIRQALVSLGIEHDVLRGGYAFAMLGPVREGNALMFDGFPSLATSADIVWRPLDPAPTYEFDLVWLSGPTSGPLEAFIETCRQEVARRGLASAKPDGVSTQPLREAEPVAIRD
jgi:DNA-binding transcriptional LysR family regulator